MKTLVIILTLCSLLTQAQHKKVVLKPDASGSIVIASAYKTYNLKPYDTVSIQGIVNKVWVDSIPKPYVVRWDTTAHPLNDTIYISASYIVKTTPNNQKIKWTNTTTGGQVYLPATPAVGFTFYFINRTGKTIQADKHLVYQVGKNWKTPDSYRVTFYSGVSKVWVDDKKRYRIQQL